jgi:protease-4
MYMLFILYLAMSDTTGTGVPLGDHTGLVELDGIISSDSRASADVLITGLQDAFKNKHTKGVIIRANSPGGSPVQADYVYNEIKRLKKKYPDIPVYAVISDACVSACYYIVSAADKIYANETSLVGSIGVISEGFGFVGTLDKLGMQRRIYTAGKNKGILDPFSPERESDVKHMHVLLDEVHQHFINAVRSGRGDRLKTDTPDLFSGLFWTGQQGLAMGLVDEFASAGTVARDVIGEEDIVDYTPEEDWLTRISDRFGAVMSHTLSGLQQWHLR